MVSSDPPRPPFPIPLTAAGIQGTVPDQLDGRLAHALGAAIGRLAVRRRAPCVVVGRDARLSGVELAAALQAGIRAAGVKVVDVGTCPMPLVHFATRLVGTPLGVAVTGGHREPRFNGFRVLLDGTELHGDALAALCDEMAAGSAPAAPVPGGRAMSRMLACYVARLLCDVRLARPLKVAVDCGNGLASIVAPTMLRELGCEVTELFCTLDETYPNHPPDPGNVDNLKDLVYCLRYADCELGLAFDADAERLVVVTRSGRIVWGDRLLILFARDLLVETPGATIVYDAHGSRHVARSIRAAGGRPVMCKPGSVSLHGKQQELGAPLAGETGGRMWFADRWYGFADAAYAAARLLEIVSREDDASAVLDSLPEAFGTPELRAGTGRADPSDVIDTLRHQGEFAGAEEAIVVDGLRVEYPDGFGIASPGHASRDIVFRFEGDNPQALSRIQTIFRRQMRRVAPRVQLPF